MVQAHKVRRSFFNYVDQILPILTTYLSLVDIDEGLSLLSSGNISIPLTFPVHTTYLPLLVNIIKECPIRHTLGWMDIERKCLKALDSY